MTQRGARVPGAGAAAVDGHPPSVARGARVLLLGVGNDLRGDDGAGPALARSLVGEVPWDVRVVHGLVPELALDLARVDVAIVVDADADPTLERPRWRSHEAPGSDAPAGSDAAAAAAPHGTVFGHSLDAATLLALCQALYGRRPLAATLSLPARDVALGESLGSVAAAGVAAARAELVRLASGC